MFKIIKMCCVNFHILKRKQKDFHSYTVLSLSVCTETTFTQFLQMNKYFPL